ncbi:hypothetical protein ACOMHN_003313 [Nucella lapillus]
MDGTQIVIDSSEPVVSAANLDSIALLTGLGGSSVGLIPSSTESTLTFSLTSLPLTLAGNLSSMAKDQRDLAVSAPDFSLTAQNALETLVRITDTNFSVQSADLLKSDTLSKQAFEEKGPSPLNLLNSSAFVDTGHSSPAPAALQYRTQGNGGDTMLSALNNDNEILTESAFDVNTNAPPGLGQLDDNLFSGLGYPPSHLQGQGGNTFDLFDSSVNDPLSPFGDAGLAIDAPSLPAMDSERSAETVIDEAKPVIKSSSVANKKSSHNQQQQQQQLQQQQQQQSAAQSQSGLGSPGKCSVSCQICGKQFNNVSALAKHRLTHSDERKYLCTVCNKGFKRQDHLNGHQMTHLDKKPFGCPLENCDKGYCDARSLRRHLEAHHHLTTEVAQTHVLASMAASGITPPAQRNGKGKSAEAAALAAAAKATQAAAAVEGGIFQRMNYSPSYSATSTPSPSQGSGNSQNHFFHFEVQPNKVGTTGGSVAVKMDPDTGELGMGKLQEVTLQQHKNMLHTTTTTAVTTGEQGQQQQFQVQFQLQQAPADILAVVQAEQLQLLQQQQQQQLLQQAQQQKHTDSAASSLGAAESATTGVSSTKKKAATDDEAKAKVQELSAQTTNGVGIDGCISIPNEVSWQDRAQVYNFVGTPGSGDQSPVSLSGELSPNMAPQVSPSPSPGSVNPTSPLHNAQHRLQWPAPHSPQKKKDKDNDKGEGPVQCSVCERRFKSLPALNGHMRLHGGYLKKDGEGKHSGSKKSSTSSSSSTTSSPSTPTDMGPPPPPPRPAAAHPSHAPPPTQHSPLSACSPQAQQPTSPTVQVHNSSGTGSNPTALASPQPVVTTALAADPSTGLQTFYLADAQTLQQVGFSQVSAEVLQQQHQFLQQQLELQQQMAARLKEQQDIRSLEEQLKQNIHEQRFSRAPLLNPPTPQVQQAIPIAVSQVNETLSDVAEVLSPLRAASPQTQHAEQIKKLVEGFQQVEELHRQQQQQQQMLLQLPQLTAEQIEQLQQQHSQLGLPPLQPLQLQQLLQDQLQQQQQQQQQLLQQHQQQQQQQPQSQEPLDGLQLGQGHMLQSQLSGGESMQSSVHLGSVLVSATPTINHVSAVNAMTPGLPGGVLSNGQQLQLGTGTLVSLPAATTATPSSATQQTMVPLMTSSQQVTSVENAVPTIPLTVGPSEHFLSLAQPHLVVSAPMSMTETVVHQHLGVPTIQTVSLGESVDIQDPAMSQLIGHMADLEGGMGSELLHLSNPHGGPIGDALSGAVFGQQGSVAEKLPGFQSFQSLISTDSGLSHPSSHVALDSIKQDVMLSSAVQTTPLSQGVGDQSSDRLLTLDDLSQSSAIKTSHSEIKRRLSADSENSRKLSLSSSSSLTITSLLNKGPAFAGHLFKKTDAGNSNIISPPAGRVRVRSKSGDVHKLMRSKSVDNSFLRQRSNTEESVYRPRKCSGDETFIGRSKSHGEDYLSQSDGAGVFRNPSTLPGPLKIKRKHRPSPLFIPPTLSSFQSRLRSPRVWDGGEGKGKGHTPPPYTPPPMLSPIRSGSGLFWSMNGTRPLTPQSAPVSARLSLSRRGSMGVDSIVDAGARESDEESPPPETDVKPHINMGEAFQVAIPPFNMSRHEAVLEESKEDLMWDPSIMDNNTDEDVQNYQYFACSAAVKDNGSNVEYALHLLNLARGDIQKATLMLMGPPPVLPVGHGLLTYKYQESDSWNEVEIQSFHEALMDFDKDFFLVSRRVCTKSVRECVQFYYFWKKVCPDDLKRLRTLRKKRISQNAQYKLRSQQPASGGGDPTPPPQGAALTSGQDEYDYDGSDSEMDEQNGTKALMGTEVMEGDLASETSVLSSLASSPAPTPPSHHTLVGDLTSLGLVGMSGKVMVSTPPHVLQPSPTPVMTSVATGGLSAAAAAAAAAIQRCPTPPQPQAQPAFPCDYAGCNAVLTSRQSLNRHMRKHLKEKKGDSPPYSAPAPRKPRPSTPSRSPVYDHNGEEIFPCKVCDRVFNKVKSRSAHMKSHRVADPDKPPKGSTTTTTTVSAALLSSSTVPSPLSDL